MVLVDTLVDEAIDEAEDVVWDEVVDELVALLDTEDVVAVLLREVAEQQRQRQASEAMSDYTHR